MLETVLGVDFISGTEVKQLLDKLSQRVYDLEQGIGAITQFQMVKGAQGPEDVDAAYHHVEL